MEGLNSTKHVRKQEAKKKELKKNNIILYIILFIQNKIQLKTNNTINTIKRRKTQKSICWQQCECEWQTAGAYSSGRPGRLQYNKIKGNWTKFAK